MCSLVIEIALQISCFVPDGIHEICGSRKQKIRHGQRTGLENGVEFAALMWQELQESCAIAKMTVRCALYK